MQSNININIKQAPRLDDRLQETINYCCSITFLQHDRCIRESVDKGEGEICMGENEATSIVIIIVIILILIYY